MQMGGGGSWQEGIRKTPKYYINLPCGSHGKLTIGNNTVYHTIYGCNSEAYLPVNDSCIALYIKHLSDQMRKNIIQFLITVYKETKYQLLC